jgi:hypothetical protein
MYRLSPKAGGREVLGVEFVIGGYSSAEPMEERRDLDADFSRIVSARGRARQGGSNIEEPWVNADIEAVEMLFVKIENGAFRGAALQPRGGGFFAGDWPSDLDLVTSLVGSEVLRWLAEVVRASVNPAR